MNQRRAISLFTGAGGLDLGFEAAGFDTFVAVEIDDQAVETLRHNRPWPVLHGDIHGILSSQILRTGGLEEGEADVLLGGPPCQPFSKAGYWASGDSLRLDDPRAGTLGAYLRVVRDAQPRAFLLENVPGLAFKGKSEGLALIERKIEEINRERGTEYVLSVAQLNAANHGVPQVRERVFIVGSRDGKSFRFPAPTHQPIPDDGQKPVRDLPLYTTAWDALGDLEDDDDPELEPTGKWADLLPSIPEGENYLWHTDRRGGLELFGWRRRYWSFLLKLAKARPSWTLQAQPGPAVGPFHWKSRRLSPREMARLQTFPDGFEITGDLRAVQRQLGNAVPSALGEVLAREIRVQLLEDEVPTQGTLLPPVRHPIPPPEDPKPVPRKYHRLIGNHEAHPGNGRGFGAQKRKRGKRGSAPGTGERLGERLPLFAAPRGAEQA